MAAKKKPILGLKTAYIWCIFGIQSVNQSQTSIHGEKRIFLLSNNEETGSVLK